MTSLVRRHRERMAAAAIAASGIAASALSTLPRPEATEYEQLLEQLGEDLRTLSNIQSVERKIEAKRAMIARYDAWIEGALRAGGEGKATQDEIVVTMLVWHIDVGSWIMALQLAVHVLCHGLQLPDRYKRTPATLIAEEIADASLTDIDAVDQATLFATGEITDGHDMPDQVRAKLAKARGRKLMQEAEQFDPTADNAIAGGKASIMAAALSAMRRARTLDEKAGVKKDIELLERELKKLAPPAT